MSGGSFVDVSTLRKIILVCLLLAPLCAASDHWKDSDYEESHDEVRDFVAGGLVHVRLKVGDLHILRSDSNKIRVHYTVKSRSESRMKDAHLDLEVRDRDANIEFHAALGGNTQFDVELEVPKNTNLDVHEKVGDLTIEDIEGDKDLELGVGDIRVAAGHSGYHLVRASTSIGDVNGNGLRGEQRLAGQDFEVSRRWQVRVAGTRRGGRYYAGVTGRSLPSVRENAKRRKASSLGP